MIENGIIIAIEMAGGLAILRGALVPLAGASTVIILLVAMFSLHLRLDQPFTLARAPRTKASVRMTSTRKAAAPRR